MAGGGAVSCVSGAGGSGGQAIRAAGGQEDQVGLQFATILSVVAVIAGAQGALLAFLWLTDRRSGLSGWWSAALCALAAGCGLAVWRAAGAPFAVGVLAGGLLLFSAGLIWQALRFFEGRPAVWPALAGAPLAWMAGVTLVADQLDPQKAANTAGFMLAVLLGLALYETLRARREALPSRPLLAASLAVAIFCLLVQLVISLRADWIAVNHLAGDPAGSWGVWLALAAGISISTAAAMAFGMSRERREQSLDVMVGIDPDTGALRTGAFLGPASRLVAAQHRQGGMVTFARVAFDGEDQTAVEGRLRQVHERLMARARAADISARFGPGVIAVVMPDVSPEAAGVLLRRVLDSCPRAWGEGGRRVRVRARVGLASSADVGHDLRALMQAAEAASDDAGEQDGPDDAFADRLAIYSGARRTVRRAAGMWPGGGMDADGSGGDALVEEAERAAQGQGGGGGVVAFPGVAVEPVAGVVKMDLEQAGVTRLDGQDAVHRNMGVAPGEMAEHRAQRRQVAEGVDPAAVIDDRR